MKQVAPHRVRREESDAASDAMGRPAVQPLAQHLLVEEHDPAPCKPRFAPPLGGKRSPRMPSRRCLPMHHHAHAPSVKGAQALLLVHRQAPAVEALSLGTPAERHQAASCERSEKLPLAYDAPPCAP